MTSASDYLGKLKKKHVPSYTKAEGMVKEQVNGWG